MKKLLMVVGMVAVLAMAANAADVTSVNVAGVYTVDIPASGGYNLVALNIDSIDPAEQTLVDFFGTQLRDHFLPTQCDKVHIYDPGVTGYRVFGRKTGAGYKEVSLAGGWNLADTNIALTAGMAFWLQSGDSAAATTVTLTGEAVSAAQAFTGIVPSYQQVGYPFSQSVDANTTGLTNGTPHFLPTQCDVLLVYNGAGGYNEYGLKGSVGGQNGTWYSTSDWNAAVKPVVNIPIGVGCWYKAKNGYIWTEDNKYLGNL